MSIIRLVISRTRQLTSTNLLTLSNPPTPNSPLRTRRSYCLGRARAIRWLICLPPARSATIFAPNSTSYTLGKRRKGVADDLRGLGGPAPTEVVGAVSTGVEAGCRGSLRRRDSGAARRDQWPHIRGDGAAVPACPCVQGDRRGARDRPGSPVERGLAKAFPCLRACCASLGCSCGHSSSGALCASSRSRGATIVLVPRAVGRGRRNTTSRCACDLPAPCGHICSRARRPSAPAGVGRWSLRNSAIIHGRQGAKALHSRARDLAQ